MCRIALPGNFPVLLAALVFLLAGAQAKADWINLTGAETSPNIAEIYVLDDHVKLILEIYVGDLRTFDDLVPDDWLKDTDVRRDPLEERMRRFSSGTFQFVTDSGEKLTAQLALVEPRLRKDRQSPFAGMRNPYTRQRVPEPPADKRVLYAEVIYPFRSQPRSLTIVPPLDEEGRAKVTVGFITYHKSVPVIDFRYLGAPATLNLDWDDPWYSRFENPNLKRHHKSALMSFLYVEPFEVRHEILTRVKDMAEWMDLGLRGSEYIEVDELEPLKQRIGEFLLTRNPVKIDGKSLKPILDRSSYVTVSINGIQLLEQPQRLEVSTAIVGVIITYLTKALPDEVSVDWDLFSSQIRRIPATSIDPAGPLPTFITPEDNVHTWTNFLKTYQPPTVANVRVQDTISGLSLPLGSMLCLAGLLAVTFLLWSRRRANRPLRLPLALGVALVVAGIALYPFARVSVSRPTGMISAVEDDEARLILDGLLQNVYRAFDFREESDVYDKLAVSVSGDLLADIYLQNRKSFAVKKAGGAQARVKEVTVQEVSAKRASDPALTFDFRAKWTALGTVGHWGHVHTRKNAYDAIVKVSAVDGHWKITGLELLEERRVQPWAAPAPANGPGGAAGSGTAAQQASPSAGQN